MGDTEKDATYLKPCEVEIQIAFSFGLGDNFLCPSVFGFSPPPPIHSTRSGMGGFDFFFFFLLWLLIPSLTLNGAPLCFLLGECVAFFSPHQEVAASLFSPTRNSAKPFSPLTQGRGWRVCGTLVCPEAAFRLLWSAVA